MQCNKPIYRNHSVFQLSHQWLCPGLRYSIGAYIMSSGLVLQFSVCTGYDCSGRRSISHGPIAWCGNGLSLNTTDSTQQKHVWGWIDDLAIKYLLFKCEDWRAHINGGLPVSPASGGRGRGSPEQAERDRELWV